MTESMAVLAAGCILQLARTELTATSDGWEETLRLEVVAEPTCPTITFPLPARARWVGGRAKAKYIDGTGLRLTEARWEHLPPDLAGQSRTVLHLPDLWQGDRVRVDVSRTFPPGPLVLAGNDGVPWTVHAGVDVDLSASEGATRHPRRNRLTTQGGSVTATAPNHTPHSPAVVLTPPERARLERTITLQVPGGDPQIALYPGAGSMRRVELRWTVDPSERTSGLLVPAPDGVELSFEAEPERVADLIMDAGVPRVRVQPFEGRARVRVSWTEADAPTYGARRPDEAELAVHVDDGRIAWEGDAWRLVEVNGRPVLPDRTRLLQGLDARFRDVSIPEPGAPASLRGQPASWELAEALIPALEERVVAATWPAEPLWPRRLLRARRSRAVTPIEATLILARWSSQLGFDAQWAVVRPHPLAEPAPVHSPAGYERPVLRLRLADEERWIDATCTVCATFELPLDLQGAPALGPGIETTPPQAPGRWYSSEQAGEVTWELHGTAALGVREWLATVPAEDRSRRLAEHMAGAGARLVASDGLADAGADVRLVAVGPGGVDPLVLSPAPGDVWVPWIGERVVDRPGRPAVTVARALDTNALRYRAQGTQESLVILARRVPAADRSALAAAREQPVPPPPAGPDSE